MNRFFSWIPAIQLRQVLVTMLLGLMFLVGTAFSGAVPQAIAKSLIPEADSYQVDQQTGGYRRLNDTRSARPEDKTQQSGSARIEEKARSNAEYSGGENPPGRNKGLASDQSYVKRNGYYSNGGRQHQANKQASNFESNENYVSSSVRSKTDSVREKLNLDEPIYPGTKEFISDVKERTNNVVENTKDAIGGVVDDVKDTVSDSFERVDK